MIKNKVKQYLTVTVIMLILSGAYGLDAYADEEFWVTYIDTPLKEDEKDGPLYYLTALDNLFDITSIITIKGNKMMLNHNNCEVMIDEIRPFSINRVLADTIADAGGSKKFNQFLKKKLHTDMSLWSTQYRVKFPDSERGAEKGCEAIQSPMIYRSPNELIISDTSYFYRAVLRNNKPVNDIKTLKGYFFSFREGAGGCRLITEKAKKQFKYCAYPDEVDRASNWKFHYKCFSKEAIDYEGNDFQIYSTKKSCVDDYDRFLGESEFQG